LESESSESKADQLGVANQDRVAACARANGPGDRPHDAQCARGVTRLPRNPQIV